MDEKKTNWALAVTGCALILLTVAVVVWARVTHGPLPESPLVQLEKAVNPPPSTHQKRVNAYIDRVAQEITYEQLVAGLNEHEDALIGVMSRTQDVVAEQMFEVCLANRRLAKLYAMLKKRSKEDADAACRKLFDEKLNILHEIELEILAGLDEMSGPKVLELPLKKPILPVQEGHIALSGALFLSAEFCTVDEALRQLQAWVEMADNVCQEYDRRSPSWKSRDLIRLSRSVFARNAYPQSRYQLSLLGSILQRRCDIDPAELVQPWLKYNKVLFCAWDADVNAYDFTYIVQGVPLDEIGALDTFIEFPSWGAPIGYQKHLQKPILDGLKMAVKECAAGTYDRDKVYQFIIEELKKALKAPIPEQEGPQN